MLCPTVLNDTTYCFVGDDVVQRPLAMVLQPYDCDLRKAFQVHENGDCKATLMTGLDAIKQACIGVAYMHSKGFVHCDIKPENMLISFEPRTPSLPVAERVQACVSDLGLAIELPYNQPSKSMPSGFYGTRGYTPPEAPSNHVKGTVQPGWDVFSMSVSISELVFGIERNQIKKISACAQSRNRRRPWEHMATRWDLLDGDPALEAACTKFFMDLIIPGMGLVVGKRPSMTAIVQGLEGLQQACK